MDKNNNTLSEVRKTAAQRMWNAENKQRAKSDASNKRTPSSIPAPDKKLKSESATLAAAVIGGAALMRMHQKLKDKKDKQATEKPVKPVKEARDPHEYDYEGEMAKGQLRTIIANAQRAHDMLEDDTNMAEWVQSKITLAADYISTVADYMQSQVNEEAIIEAHTEYDIANGGTVIYKHDGKHYMAKVSHKTGGGAGTMIHTTSSLGHKIKLNQVVSTDASDWTKFKNIKEETEQGVVEAHIASPLSAANANAEYKRQPSNTLKVDVKHLGGVSNHKAVKQHLTSKGITAGIGSSDNYHTVHLSNISHSHGEIKKKLGIKEEVELSELNKDTLYSYALKADKQIDVKHKKLGPLIKAGDTKAANKISHTISKRFAGLDRAMSRVRPDLNNESKSFFDIRKELDEKNLTPVEKIGQEELFKKKYKKVRGAPTE